MNIIILAHLVGLHAHDRYDLTLKARHNVRRQRVARVRPVHHAVGGVDGAVVGVEVLDALGVVLEVAGVGPRRATRRLGGFGDVVVAVHVRLFRGREGRRQSCAGEEAEPARHGRRRGTGVFAHQVLLPQ